MRIPLLASLKRQTLVSFRDFIFSIITKLSQLLPLFTSMDAESSTDPQRISQSPAQFDPSLPSSPISYPIKTLEELESRSYFNSFHYPFNKSSIPLPDYSNSEALPNRRRLLVCHDMGGGYLDDKWIQGSSNPDAYSIWHWYLIDVFVYFSHNLVTLPPPCWTNDAHKHGIKVLGTFITEWNEGRTVCNTLLLTKESAHMYAELLAELAVILGFDGWLLNMEVELDVGQIPNLIEFVSHLTLTMHSSKPGSLVIWYDSVTCYGDLRWQNQLNVYNKPFFDSCNGIFVNYAWKEDDPKLSADVAGERKFDIYMGIDVFGRHTYGGGQWRTNLALDLLKKNDVSASLFAPGWVYETKQPPDFQTAQNRWWDLVEKSWGIMQNYPRSIPFYSNFDQGHGYHFSVDGEQVSNAAWCNILCQSFQPFLEFSENLEPNTIQALVSFKEASYSGGGSVTFSGDLKDMNHFTTRLFQGELFMGDLPLHFIYSVKSKGNSLVGLSLSFSSTVNERKEVLLASGGNTLLTMNQFSCKFSAVIMPHRVTEVKTGKGWTIQEHNISMEGYKLTTIQAVCYKLKPEADELKTSSTSKFYAALGHLTIKADQSVTFPSSTSWLVEGQLIKWEEDGAEDSKFLSLKVVWKLKDGNNFVPQKYIVFVEKISDGSRTRTREFMGVAAVEAFYVSRLPIPSGTACLKFIIQVWGVDGTNQKLDYCPSFLLDVKR
ncbi:hypothetical protein Nepgr_006022 [Nepenthes gracilis]|uniref:mannosyl-glycoprotein endo-beta-N-acetylglucosaminidase n=1 Tax=Nepenthes gracilis TaxID=150966 RepID=A0AAD3XH09_NEPGR|nr:hypothetical protein Nepgr_006022 [Nepenthes gracilis]